MGNAQNPRSLDQSTQAKKDHHPLFADVLASVPPSSVIATAVVVPEPISNNDNKNIISNTSPPDIPPKTPQYFSTGGQSPLPGLLTNRGTDDTASARPSDQLKGWTVDMTTSVEALLENGHTSVDQIIKLLKGEYEDFSTIEGVEEYIQKLKNQNEDWIPDMPVGWTDSMTGIVRDMLQHGDDVYLIADFMQPETALQTNDIKCLEQWVKKLQSDYETELKSRTQQDKTRSPNILR